ncbi:MAG: GDP-mannose 4,6-dehydratase [Patescibacteria group bacterium]
MNILITGGAGFIGSHVARALLTRGDTVVIIDDFNDRYDPRLKEARMNHMFTDFENKPTIIRGDILDQKLIEETIQSHFIDSVIHLAAWAAIPRSIESPLIYTNANVTGTASVLEAAQKNNIARLVIASSSSVYGGISELPFRENMDIIHPISPYAATKVATEALAYTWHHLYAIPTTCLRFFTVYGPWGRPEMAPFAFTRAITTGQVIKLRGEETERDFTYIDDIVQGILASLDTANGYHVYNLGEADGVKLTRMISAFEAALGKKAIVELSPLLPGELQKTLADISLAKQDLQYQPKTSIEDGAKKFVEWYKTWYDNIFA